LTLEELTDETRKDLRAAVAAAAGDAGASVNVADVFIVRVLQDPFRYGVYLSD